jgi:peptidoglycan/LPS O-acetylase OafA/YrhL
MDFAVWQRFVISGFIIPYSLYRANLPAQLLVLTAAVVGSVAASVLFYRFLELPSQRHSSSIRYRRREPIIVSFMIYAYHDPNYANGDTLNIAPYVRPLRTWSLLPSSANIGESGYP